MSNFITTTTPLILIAAILTGLLVHDLNLDKATKLAFAPPAAGAVYSGAAHSVVARSEHIHVERGSATKSNTTYHSSPPRVYPPRDDDKRYIKNKKNLSLSGGDSNSQLWPSV